MPKVHRSSTVDSQAQLADDVDIGPNCVVQGAVRIGAGTRLIGNVWLIGPLSIGNNNLIYPNACIGFEPQHLKYVPGTGAGIVIGDRNILREGVTIHRAYHEEHPTTLGNNNLLMCNSHMGHDAIVGDNCTLANGSLLGGHVTVLDNVTLGGNCGVHQFCRIGRLAMVSGVIAVTQDVPPFCIAYDTRIVGSLNIVGLRRAGYREHIPNLKRAFEILYQSRHTLPNAAKRIEKELSGDPLCLEFAEFVQTSKRGITWYKPSDEIAE